MTAIAFINYSLYPVYKLQLIMEESMWTVLFGKVFELWLLEQEESTGRSSQYRHRIIRCVN